MKRTKPVSLFGLHGGWREKHRILTGCCQTHAWDQAVQKNGLLFKTVLSMQKALQAAIIANGQPLRICVRCVRTRKCASEIPLDFVSPATATVTRMIFLPN
jgi:hypothetical protein